jgi:queuine tRNA-ribosyltransferase
MQTTFTITHTNDTFPHMRAGEINTPHGTIKTPAFIPVSTKATLKSLTPEQLNSTGAQATLANAYHLHLRPGEGTVARAGGLATFMNWNKPTFTDSGGFQVMSLGSGLGKIVDMDAAHGKSPQKMPRLAKVDDDGVSFRSHINGDKLRFTPEISMQIQHNIGADIMFAFDELTTIADDYFYQKKALLRTYEWAKRCIAEHEKLNARQENKQALFGVIQGANYEDLRKLACEQLGDLPFDGYGIGGALEKDKMSEIINWCVEILPKEKPKHLLGIGDPIDIFAGVENGMDTFDCVLPTRNARNGSLLTHTGALNIKKATYKEDFTPLETSCACYTCRHFTRAYVHHLFRADELLANTLASIHNVHFIVKLVDDIREHIAQNTYLDFKKSFLDTYLSTQR